jgi:hypothetical protein
MELAGWYQTVPYFTAMKPIKMTYRYDQAICQQFECHSGTIKHMNKTLPNG